MSGDFPIVLFDFYRVEVVRVQGRRISATGRYERIPSVAQHDVNRYLRHVFVLATNSALVRMSNVRVARVIEIAPSYHYEDNSIHVERRFVA